MSKKQTVTTKIEKKHVERPGIHSKTKVSKLKTSKNYSKPYKGQGR